MQEAEALSGMISIIQRGHPDDCKSCDRLKLPFGGAYVRTRVLSTQSGAGKATYFCERWIGRRRRRRAMLAIRLGRVFPTFGATSDELAKWYTSI